jgi:5-formyltetrahydrofolate cyclo-ligase
LSQTRRKKKPKSFEIKDLNLEPIRKKLLRAWLRARLAGHSASARKKASLKIARTVCSLAAFRRAKSVLGFVSLSTEVDTAPILKNALKQGKTLVLPFVDLENKELKLFTVADLKTGLKKGPLGVRQPDPARAKPARLSDIGFMLVPGLAFDRSHRRLGRGGGFYDRLLKKRPGRTAAVSPAFSFQVFTNVPHEKHDQTVGRVVTEKEMF